MKQVRAWRQALAAVVCASAGVAAQAGTVYDPTLAFQTQSNAGVWQYGWASSNTASYGLNLFDRGTVFSDAKVWDSSTYSTLGTPAAWLNTGSTRYGVLQGQLALHPGPAAGADAAVLRFNVQADGVYDVVGRFYAGDVGAMSGDLVLDRQWAQALFHVDVTSDGSDSAFSILGLALKAGQTLDLLVGNRGSFYSGNTPVSLQITRQDASSSTVPVPATWTLVAVAAWAAQRRRTRSGVAVGR